MMHKCGCLEDKAAVHIIVHKFYLSRGKFLISVVRLT
jgi:hypothetical protein